MPFLISLRMKKPLRKNKLCSMNKHDDDVIATYNNWSLIACPLTLLLVRLSLKAMLTCRSVYFLLAQQLPHCLENLMSTFSANMRNSSVTSRKSDDVFVERVRINPREKIRDQAGIWTQDLLNASQTLLPLSHLDPRQRNGRQAT